MPKVIGVRFRTSPRVYYFSPIDGEEYPKNSKVVVESQRGSEIATVVMPVTDVAEEKLVAPLKPIERKATEDDIKAAEEDAAAKQGIIATAKEKVAARGLDMKIVDCEYTADRSKLVLYFTAEQRVDFRELVRDLASAFHMRIDLRQIGARDECKLIGSLGACGLPCCCGRFESDSEHVSIKMAKTQNLALTPNKINGMCGRLLCCLSYENKTYEDIMKRMPKHGTIVTCPDGRTGSVVSCTPLTEKVKVRVGDDENFEFCEYSLGELNLTYNKDKDRKPAENDKQVVSDDRPKTEDNGGNNRPRDNKKFKNKNNRNNGQNNSDGKNGGGKNNNGGKNDGKARGEREAPKSDSEQATDNQSKKKNRNKHWHNKKKQNNNGGVPQGGNN